MILFYPHQHMIFDLRRALNLLANYPRANSNIYELDIDALCVPIFFSIAFLISYVKNHATFLQSVICLLTCNIRNFWVIKWWNHNFRKRKIFCWLTRRLEGYAIVHRTMTHLISQNFLFQLQNCVFAFLVLNRKLIRTFVIC